MGFQGAGVRKGCGCAAWRCVHRSTRPYFPKCSECGLGERKLHGGKCRECLGPFCSESLPRVCKCGQRTRLVFRTGKWTCHSCA